MRKHLLAASLALLLGSCSGVIGADNSDAGAGEDGGSTGSTGSTGGTGSTGTTGSTGASDGGDLGIGPGVYCGADAGTCATGACCVDTSAKTATCSATCASGMLSLACDGPEDCSGNPCCAPIMNGKTSGAVCSAATTDCVPKIDFVTKNGQSRLCHADADCTAAGSSFADCCSDTRNGYTLHFCFDKQLVSLARGVTCP